MLDNKAHSAVTSAIDGILMRLVTNNKPADPVRPSPPSQSFMTQPPPIAVATNHNHHHHHQHTDSSDELVPIGGQILNSSFPLREDTIKELAAWINDSTIAGGIALLSAEAVRRPNSDFCRKTSAFFESLQIAACDVVRSIYSSPKEIMKRRANFEIETLPQVQTACQTILDKYCQYIVQVVKDDTRTASFAAHTYSSFTPEEAEESIQQLVQAYNTYLPRLLCVMALNRPNLKFDFSRFGDDKHKSQIYIDSAPLNKPNITNRIVDFFPPIKWEDDNKQSKQVFNGVAACFHERK